MKWQPLILQGYLRKVSNKKKNGYVHGGNLWDIERRFGLAQKDITDFSANINPFGLPESISQLVADNIEKITHYPDPENRYLTEEISRFFNINTNHIICGNGSNQLLYLLLGYLRPQRALICIPSYSEYQKACVVAGTKCIFVGTSAKSGFKPDIGELARQSGRAGFLFICNPNNPTGNLLGREEMEYILDACQKQGTFLMVDEAFLDFAGNDLSMSNLVEKYDNLAVLKSLTKFFAMPGLRLGFMAGGPNLVDKLKFMQPTWSVNHLAQAVGAGFLKDNGYIQRTIDYVSKEKDRFYHQLKSIPSLEPFYPSANFILLKILKKGTDSKKLAEYCIKRHHILIRDCSNFRGLDRSYIRVAVRLKAENNRLLKVLKGYFGE